MFIRFSARAHSRAAADEVGVAPVVERAAHHAECVLAPADWLLVVQADGAVMTRGCAEGAERDAFRRAGELALVVQPPADGLLRVAPNRAEVLLTRGDSGYREVFGGLGDLAVFVAAPAAQLFVGAADATEIARVGDDGVEGEAPGRGRERYGWVELPAVDLLVVAAHSATLPPGRRQRGEVDALGRARQYHGRGGEESLCCQPRLVAPAYHVVFVAHAAGVVVADRDGIKRGVSAGALSSSVLPTSSLLASSASPLLVWRALSL